MEQIPIQQIIEDTRLYPFNQIVLIAFLLYGDWEKVRTVLNQPVQAIDLCRKELIRAGWIQE